MLPVNPSAAFDPSPSAVGQKSWNRSAAFEINLSGIASAAFYLEIDVTNLHDLPERSRDDMDVGAALTFALASPRFGEGLSSSDFGNVRRPLGHVRLPRPAVC